MKKVYAICLLTLAAVVFDVVLLHTGSVRAQSNQTVRVERLLFNINTRSVDAPINGRVVGFHCIDTPGGPVCFIASGFVPGDSH